MAARISCYSRRGSWSTPTGSSWLMGLSVRLMKNMVMILSWVRRVRRCLLILRTRRVSWGRVLFRRISKRPSWMRTTTTLFRPLKKTCLVKLRWRRIFSKLLKTLSTISALIMTLKTSWMRSRSPWTLWNYSSSSATSTKSSPCQSSPTSKTASSTLLGGISVMGWLRQLICCFRMIKSWQRLILWRWIWMIMVWQIRVLLWSWRRCRSTHASQRSTTRTMSWVLNLWPCSMRLLKGRHKTRCSGSYASQVLVRPLRCNGSCLNLSELHRRLSTCACRIWVAHRRCSKCWSRSVHWNI